MPRERQITSDDPVTKDVINPSWSISKELLASSKRQRVYTGYGPMVGRKPILPTPFSCQVIRVFNRLTRNATE
ncbi:MAG: hypothetical protein ACRD3Q_16995, partial [Terriglobales bacterium]